MIKLIMEQIEKLKDSNTYVSFRWVPPHEGILGNEQAHTPASKTTETNNPSPPTTGLKRLKSALIREGRKCLEGEIAGKTEAVRPWAAQKKTGDRLSPH